MGSVTDADTSSHVVKEMVHVDVEDGKSVPDSQDVTSTNADCPPLVPFCDHCHHTSSGSLLPSSGHGISCIICVHTYTTTLMAIFIVYLD